MKKKLLIITSIVLAMITLLIGYIVWSSHNTATAEADKTLRDFTQSTTSQWYCENGYVKGFDNKASWWEEIYLSSTETESTANKVNEYFKSRGYSTAIKHIENSQDSHDLGKSYWEINGARNEYSLQIRVSSKTLTTNSCHIGYSNMNGSLNPEKFNSVIVVKFKDLSGNQSN